MFFFSLKKGASRFVEPPCLPLTCKAAVKHRHLLPIASSLSAYHLKAYCLQLSAESLARLLKKNCLVYDFYVRFAF